MDWSRFKLKSSKPRALVNDKGKVVEWVVEGSEEVTEKLILDGDVIPNVSEKPIKFLGRWIRADATHKVIIEQSQNDLN
jgi:hypothetical protein